jgi:phospholipase/carboxylesterase
MKQVTKIEGFHHIYLAAQNANHPLTLLLLHGTGGNEYDMISMGRGLDTQANLLSPRGKVLEEGRPRFFRRISEGIFDLDDLKARTLELAEFTQEASTTYHFDLDKTVAVGFSNGANIAGSLLLLNPRLLAGAILLRPMLPFVPDNLPDLTKIPILLSAGLDDPIVPPDQPRKLSELFSKCGANVSLRWYDAGHNLLPAEIEYTREWLEILRRELLRQHSNSMEAT